MSAPTRAGAASVEVRGPARDAQRPLRVELELGRNPVFVSVAGRTTPFYPTLVRAGRDVLFTGGWRLALAARIVLVHGVPLSVSDVIASVWLEYATPVPSSLQNGTQRAATRRERVTPSSARQLLLLGVQPGRSTAGEE
jgi:hypothetical protein